ncbi:hypothetical protein [Arcobacter sp. FWKO B]|uniref:hypothetical protein n=1 Tax=Arcobacter sp. FWKO B TaxID=2593672 RepID=UPI0018A45152|nr:hypothetical protein [Arcobacter sp. FWKO B]QOG13026.1 hypothetical protein FWKOB_10150 [Arcobacter sp. FWKO B]
MKKHLSKIAIIVTLGLGLTGCAVKQEDSTATKTMKHTVNSPAYVLVGTGYVATEVLKTAVAVGLSPLLLLKKKEVEEVEEQENKEAITGNKEATYQDNQ